ncbi:MAG TPA: hypothetical protein VIV58_32715 [Kofleriaceae bacterium]
MIARFAELFSRSNNGQVADWKAWTVIVLGAPRVSFDCLACAKDTCDFEYYMVHDPLWRSVVPDGAGMLCFDCIEARLGRNLTRADFTSARINRAHLSNPRFA